jgi:uncharacterized protein YkwD
MQATVPVMVIALAAVMSGALPPLVSANSWADRRCEVDNADLQMEQIEQHMLAAINAYRQQRGLSALESSPTLRRAAMWKSQERGRGGAEAHDDPFRRWDQRLNDCGYDPAAMKGENLAVVDGEPSLEREAEMVLRAWQNSPAHDSILTDSVFSAVGIARVRVPGTLRTYWTADFGSVRE